MSPLPLTSCMVLVAEDEYFTADEIERAVMLLGGAVLGPVPHLADALSLAGSAAIHVAVLNVKLGGETSYPAADVLERRGIPYVFATAYECDALPPRYSHVPCWTKPYSPERLAGMLQDLVSGGCLGEASGPDGAAGRTFSQ